MNLKHQYTFIKWSVESFTLNCPVESDITMDTEYR